MSLALALCLFLLLPCRNGFASLRVRHNISRASGILTSAPNTLDEKIAFFIKTNSITSLEEYGRWAVRNISYQNDYRGDQWSDPAQTLQRKYGDCEDIAFLNAAVAFVLGYDPEIYILHKKGNAHAICVIRADNGYIWFDNTAYRKTHFQSSSQLVRALQKEYGYAAARKLTYTHNPWRTPNKSSVVAVAGK